MPSRTSSALSSYGEFSKERTFDWHDPRYQHQARRSINAVDALVQGLYVDKSSSAAKKDKHTHTKRDLDWAFGSKTESKPQADGLAQKPRRRKEDGKDANGHAEVGSLNYELSSPSMNSTRAYTPGHLSGSASLTPHHTATPYPVCFPPHSHGHAMSLPSPMEPAPMMTLRLCIHPTETVAFAVFSLHLTRVTQSQTADLYVPREIFMMVMATVGYPPNPSTHHGSRLLMTKPMQEKSLARHHLLLETNKSESSFASSSLSQLSQ